ncbi:ABC transporter permease [Planctomycetota bacterium]
MKYILLMPLVFIRLILQSIRLAMGQIWANKIRSMLTTLGIIIGVASVTAVIAALTGLRTKIMADLEAFGTNRIFVWPDWPDHGPKKNASWRVIRFWPQEFEGMLDHCPSVREFTFRAGRNQGVRYGEKAIESASINGIQAAWHNIESRKVLEGRPFSVVDETQGRRVCLVNASVRDKLRMNKNPVGEFLIIGRHSYRVVGVVEERPNFSMIGGGRGEEFEICIPFQTMWNLYEPWFGVQASSKSPELSDEAKAEMGFFLRQTRNLKPGEPDTFNIWTMESEVRSFKKMSQGVTMVAGGVVSVSLLVGGIGIMNIMLVSVSERTREIGLRKAVGAKNSAILTQFLIEAIVLCCIGGLLGVGLGQGITMGIAKLPGANLDRAFIPGWAIAMAFGFSAVVGIFFGMFPAIKAARLDPIEALRHE